VIKGTTSTKQKMRIFATFNSKKPKTTRKKEGKQGYRFTS